MRNDETEDTLGGDGTEVMAPKARRSTTVLSVRVTSEELAQLEIASRATGKTLSQLVREAIAGCMNGGAGGQPSITVSVEGITTVHTGPSTSRARSGASE